MQLVDGGRAARARVAPSRRRAGPPATRPGPRARRRRGGRCGRGGPTRTRSARRCATRRITSSVSRRGSVPRGISRPAKRSQPRKSLGWRPSVRNRFGGVGPRRRARRGGRTPTRTGRRLPAARRDPRSGALTVAARAAPWSAARPRSRAISSAVARSRCAARSTSGWSEHPERQHGPTQRGATIRRERRRSRARARRWRRRAARRARRAQPLERGRRLGAEAAAGHVGVDLGEVADADARARGAQLDAQRVPERLDRRLRRAVGAEQRGVDGGGERGDRQRVAAAVGDVRARRAQRVVGAEHVDRERALEDLRVAADERELRGDAGVGDDDVETAERGRRRRRRPRRPASRSATSQLAPGRVAAARRRPPPALGLEARASATRAPRSCRRRGERGADAARGAGDQHAASATVPGSSRDPDPPRGTPLTDGGPAAGVRSVVSLVLRHHGFFGSPEHRLGIWGWRSSFGITTCVVRG